MVGQALRRTEESPQWLYHPGIWKIKLWYTIWKKHFWNISVVFFLPDFVVQLLTNSITSQKSHTAIQRHQAQVTPTCPRVGRTPQWLQPKALCLWTATAMEHDGETFIRMKTRPITFKPALSCCQLSAVICWKINRAESFLPDSSVCLIN